MLGAVGLLAACHSDRIRLTPAQQQIQQQLQGLDPHQHPLPRATPLIDVHTHTFNARYLPLRGILLGKRDVSLATLLLSDACAATLAEALVDHTQNAAVAGQPAQARRMERRKQLLARGDGALCRVLLTLLEKAEKAGAWDPQMSLPERMQRLDALADRMNAAERQAVTEAVRMMGMAGHLQEADRQSALRGAVRFLWVLTQDDAVMPELYRSFYQGAAMLGEPLQVSHMMDLAPVYDQPADGGSLYDFAGQQLPRMAHFQAQADSGLLFFVAYNPYRDHWNGGRSGDALRLVQDAVTRHAAWGVKVYPPSGYRAAGNAVKRRPRPLGTGYPGAQWQARYGAWGTAANAGLDRALEELLQWCRAHEIPVFTHCGTGEFEARKGYGRYHSDPRFWRDYLRSHPEPDGSPCRLRLCLGHAGGGDFWFGGGPDAGWGELVYELCTTYPNVYCEITAHGELTQPDRRAYFVDRVARCFEQSAAPPPDGSPPRHAFARKLIYGTDWYLPDAAERRQILEAVQTAFLHERLRPHYADYFFGNALRFLNARDRLQDARHPLPASLRGRLERLLRALPD